MKAYSPKVKNEVPQVISGLKPTGNSDSAKNIGPTKAVTNIITSMIYRKAPLKLKIISLKRAVSSKL
jgi:hypothetical protein